MAEQDRPGGWSSSTGKWVPFKQPARLGQRLTALNAQGEAVEAVVVPKEATEAIFKAGADAVRGYVAPLMHMDDAYRAMIAAANG